MDIETFTYLVVFNSKTQKYDGPILFEANGNGTMHLFDDEMYSIFDALEFVMHMPRNTFDMFNIDENLMDASHDTPHHIVLNAFTNTILMTRLFTYIVEAQQKNPQYKTLSDAWSGIIASNAIHELTATSKRFQKWMNEPGENGKPRIVDFQLNRCVGRLRRTHIYSDTIAILKEMLAEEGMEGKFDNILSQNDFFPESFFYQFLGSPENVFLYSEIFGKYIHRNMQNSD